MSVRSSVCFALVLMTMALAVCLPPVGTVAPHLRPTTAPPRSPPSSPSPPTARPG
ncbi:MAG: hypothetical protein V1772_06065 [Chloroflexota bacterium]